MSFVQSLLTTGLMAYRIWSADRRSARYRADTGNLMPILRILVESAALQLLVEMLVLIFYASGLNSQYILLETITPLVVRGTRSLCYRPAADYRLCRPSPSTRSRYVLRCALRRR